MLELINSSSVRQLKEHLAIGIGFGAVTGDDDAFVSSRLLPTWDRAGVPWRYIVEGDRVRDWNVANPSLAIFPYDDSGKPINSQAIANLMWPLGVTLRAGKGFGGTREEMGKKFWEFVQLSEVRLRSSLLIAFAFVSTHNHFVLNRSVRIFKQSAPVIKLPIGATEDEHLALLGVLNSTTACFWLKQNSQSKAGSGMGRGIQPEGWMERYEFTGTTLEDFPLPDRLPLERARELDGIAQELSALAPSAMQADQVPTAASAAHARATSNQLRARMIAVQEELDWEVYRLYGLVNQDVSYGAIELPALEWGERAFEIALARAIKDGSEETAWFSRHGSTPITEIPERWPAGYRELVQRRLDLIASDPFVRLLEKPEYKRRWAQEPWEKREERALRAWLLDRLEDRKYWFDPQGRPLPRSVAQLADEVARDAYLTSVLALWEGRPDVPVTQSLVRLLADEAVPFLAAYRYKDTGLRKRQAWEETWALQRREDAGEDVGTIPVPPKYTSADFRKASYWHARGKLDVPKERFILYADAGRETDPTPLLGWAGWDHAQQSLALSVIITDREKDGWADERLVPLAAGLAELRPWVDQWHSEVDPAYGLSLAAFCREQLASRAAQVGMTLAQLAEWKPEPSGRGRRPRASRTDGSRQ